jgi:enoyl-[acyl-carrier protein] reductase I
MADEIEQKPAPAALMAGKRGLVLGVANNHSIAWGIAETLSAHGATMAFTYQSDAIAKRVRPLAEKLGADIVLPCDVSSAEDIETVIASLKDAWGGLDFLVHAVAFSDRAELNGRFLDTSRANFAQTLEISCYSFTALARAAAPLMRDGGSMITLTYDGSQRVMPHYNVMGVAKAALEASTYYLAADLGKQGIRVNAISAGPMRTLSGTAVGNARFVYKWQGENSPMRRNISLEDVGGAALYLLSSQGGGTTGEILHVDNGYNIIGMVATD